MTGSDSDSDFDLVIVGGGPAGCAAALKARAQELRVAMLTAPGPARPGVVESLPPAGRRLLTDLGCWPEFVAAGHLPSRGVRSVWGSAHPAERESIWDPDGSGWHLDRSDFDAFLQAQAVRAGAVLVPGRLASVHSSPERIVCTDRTGQLLAGRFLLDASGRSATAASRLGARRRYDDATVATISSYQPAVADLDRRTVIEAVPEGWWYSISAGTRFRILGLVTDSDLGPAPVALPDRLSQLLAGAVPRQPARRVAANSGYLQPFAGHRWAAAGDAALSFDPLSSQGMLTALFTGRAAAVAIGASLAGSPDALTGYVQRLAAIRRTYRLNLALHYGAERRWPSAPFWQRRHAEPTQPVNPAQPESQPSR